MCTIGFVTDVLGIARFQHGPVSPIAALCRLPVYFGGGFLIIYLIQLLGLKSTEPRTMICNRCHKVKNEDGALECSCGGQFEPLENWRWVEDDDPDAAGPETQSQEGEKENV